MKSLYLVGLGLGIVAVASCSASEDNSLSCGAGTVRVGNQCVASGGGASGTGGSSAGGLNSGGQGAVGHAGEAGAGDEAGSGGVSAEAGSGGQDSAGAAASSGGQNSGGTAGGNGNAGSGGGGSDPGDLITSALECGSRDVTGATVVSEPITQDTTWSGVIHLPNGLSVRNEPTLTISPGTKIIVGHNATMELGYLGSHATIVAKGTIEKPIKFCGETDSAGYWAGLIFRSGIKTSSVLKNVLIADGGGTNAALTLEMPLLVQGVQVRRSGTNGVNAAGFDRASVALTVTGSGKLPVKATAARGAEVPPNSQLTGNGTDSIDVGFTTFDTDVTLRNVGVPYRQLADVTNLGTSVITIEPGVVYGLARQKLLDFGRSSVLARGTAGKPIIFQGLLCSQGGAWCSATPGLDVADYGGRIMASGSDVRFEYVELRQLGTSNAAALSVSLSTLKVDHLNIIDAQSYAFDFGGTGKFSADSNNLKVGSQNAMVLRLGCSQVASLPADTKTTTNSVSPPHTSISCAQLLDPENNWPVAGSPYLISELRIPSGTTLTLAPGTTLRLGTSAVISVASGGTLNAPGTAASKIQFVSENLSAGWPGIDAQAGAVLNLDYVTLDRGGSLGGAISFRSPITLAHSTISNSMGWALRKAASDTTDYLTGNTFSGNKVGNITDLP